MNCEYCKEPILNGEKSENIFSGNFLAHRECVIRMVVGSVGHQQGKCSCYGGYDESEEGLTKRQAAKAAYEYFEKHNP